MGEKLRVELGRLLQTWELGLGVGVHTGVVIEGLMGGADVKAYRFVGDTVNTARRICSEARPGQLMLSEMAFAQAASITVAEAATEVVMKGKTSASKVWSVARLVEG
ncbi:MAG: adenylate/guanylate cyclase domain-containing protein [Opitutaceae bacterium]|nr:adenylate/guanylate cyclase domain-containing protein [Opitutaceae bacterium]